MADWKQITARIRRARGSKDPAGQLSNLFQKTRDAMVAFELARHFETSGQNADALTWYDTAAQRFRRADWKTKALEAVTRLGGEPAAASLDVQPDAENVRVEREGAGISAMVIPEPAAPFEQNAEVFEAQVAGADADSEIREGEADPAELPGPQTHAPGDRSGRRRRGRRGGRNRRKSASMSPSGAQSQPSPASAEPISPPRVVDSRAIPRVPVESADAGVSGIKGRFGDPGLSSRLSLLEMQFRRLLTCPPAKLEDAAHAPAGPGVFVLTDEELSTYYYVEACDTLRIAIANLARGGAGRRGTPSVKPLLADHLGIPESRVAKYLSDHCVVRWLQLDDGAAHFAHFAIAVLRPALNE